jgi:hypothetical protein
MTDKPNKPEKGSQRAAPQSKSAIDLGGIPDAWGNNGAEEGGSNEGAPSQPDPQQLDEAPNPFDSLPDETEGGVDGDFEGPNHPSEDAQNGGNNDGENRGENSGSDGGQDEDFSTPFTDDDLSGVEAASDEEIKAKVGRTDEEDLGEQFNSYSKAATQGERALRKRMFELEQRLHSVDLKERERTWIWTSPFITEVTAVMSDHLGIPKCEVYEAAILMFYRNCFSTEKRMLADMGMMLDSSTLQNQELAIEISALEDLANMAMQAEASPLNQVLEDES